MQQSDTIDVSKNIRVPAFGVPVGEEDEDLNKLDEAVGIYYDSNLSGLYTCMPDGWSLILHLLCCRGKH